MSCQGLSRMIPHRKLRGAGVSQQQNSRSTPPRAIRQSSGGAKPDRAVQPRAGRVRPGDRITAVPSIRAHAHSPPVGDGRNAHTDRGFGAVLRTTPAPTATDHGRPLRGRSTRPRPRMHSNPCSRTHRKPRHKPALCGTGAPAGRAREPGAPQPARPEPALCGTGAPAGRARETGTPLNAHGRPPVQAPPVAERRGRGTRGDGARCSPGRAGDARPGHGKRASRPRVAGWWRVSRGAGNSALDHAPRPRRYPKPVRFHRARGPRRRRDPAGAAGRATAGDATPAVRQRDSVSPRGPCP